MLAAVQALGKSSRDGLEEALGQVKDWNFLLHTAIAHGVFPNLDHWLLDIGPDIAPREFLHEVRGLYKVHARYNLMKVSELIAVLNLLESCNITAVPYKGPVLAQVACGDIALRQFVDLDILVNRNDITWVKDILIAKGFKPRYSLTEKQERMHLKNAVEFTFEHPRRTMLDVHWRFAAPYLGSGPDPEEAIARRVPVQVLGKTVYSLHPEDNLLMLCQHGTFHAWSKLGVVSDVAHMLQSQASWDWSGLLERAGRYGLRRQFLLGVSLAHELLRAPVPMEVIREVDADSSVVNLRRRVMRNLFVIRGEDLGFVDITSFYLQSRDCFKDKLALVFTRLFIPSVEDWRRVPLPDSCYWLYYLIRPLRLGLQGLVLPLLRRVQSLFRVKAVHNHH